MASGYDRALSGMLSFYGLVPLAAKLTITAYSVQVGTSREHLVTSAS
jgi:hypothetical protein